ncbi:hypothetical protein BRETT_000604 [Brettanomyces bruxellensis]|uniref:Uncharacterized protein n=1 Tax=Dekkera bruxellensis TaxID=5007 RepID=A0A871RFN6_DEKBR|nr:uncharacterized protein BRETT_000604 [Brettanomyces bruxellensis]QOU20890.1 hypothetical protein BRETT_000604 [Brettanomyces bruxellensis]
MLSHLSYFDLHDVLAYDALAYDALAYDALACNLPFICAFIGKFHEAASWIMARITYGVKIRKHLSNLIIDKVMMNWYKLLNLPKKLIVTIA